MSFPVVQLFYEIAQQTSSLRVNVCGKCQGDGGGLRWCAMVVGVMMVAVNVMVARLVVVAAVKGRGGKIVAYEDCGGSKRSQCQGS